MQKQQAKKAEQSNVKGLRTSQMHSEKPLIKIITTEDGRKNHGPVRQM